MVLIEREKKKKEKMGQSAIVRKHVVEGEILLARRRFLPMAFAHVRITTPREKVKRKQGRRKVSNYLS